MNPPDAEEISLGSKVVGAIASVFAGALAMFKFVKASLDRKADKDQVDRHHTAIVDLYSKHDKVLDLMRDKELRDNERHVELLNAIHESRE